MASRPVVANTCTAVTVHGQPAPQGSKQGFIRGGKVQLVESSKAVKPWREAVKHAALDVLAASKTSPLTGPVSVQVAFTIRKPASAPKRRITWPQKKPDLDKLLRSTLDALSDAGMWVDDSQVVEIHSTKLFPEEGVDALRTPGAIIRIWTLGATA